MTSAWSGHQEDASGQQIEACRATQLALQQLQAVDVPLDRSLTPRQRHRRLGGGHVGPEPSGEAPKGREGARGGMSQPRFELARPTLMNQAGKVPPERYGFRQRGRSRGEPRQAEIVQTTR